MHLGKATKLPVCTKNHPIFPFHEWERERAGGDVKGNIHQIQHGVQYCIWCTDIFNIIQLNFNVDIHPERHGVNVMRIRIRRVPAKKMNMRNTTMTMSSECSDIFYASVIIQNMKKSDFDATCDRYISLTMVNYLLAFEQKHRWVRKTNRIRETIRWTSTQTSSWWWIGMYRISELSINDCGLNLKLQFCVFQSYSN